METMNMVRAVVLIVSLFCAICWMVWFLNKDNKTKYQKYAQDFLNDDETPLPNSEERESK